MSNNIAYAGEPLANDLSEVSRTDRKVSRTRYVILQSLVGVILTYQLLFGPEAIVGRLTGEFIMGGVILVLGGLLLVSPSILQSAWLSGFLITIDTILITTTMYLSGDARSELYLSYFILMLVAASLRRLSHVIALSLLLSAGYAVVLYEGVVQSGVLSVGHLLGIPVLLVMAIFYGVALETIGTERQEKARLLESVLDLKQTERSLQDSRDQLERRIKKLKEDLSRANASVQYEQAERRGLERQLSEAQKMEAVGRITSGIAGEFGQLLSVIGKQTGVVLSRLKPDDPLYGPINDIFQSGERAAALTARLTTLDLHRRQLRHPISMRTVVEDLSDVIRGLLPDRIECQITIDPGPHEAEVDREGIEQVLLNLVVNAREAMPERGRLTIEVSLVQNTPDGQQLTGMAGRSDSVRIQVRDTGSGMNKDTQTRMFEPFFSTKETNAGLGLTAVYEIVKHHKGELNVVSLPGQGTTVHVYLPASFIGTTRTQSIHPSLVAKEQETVLLVEPNEIERKLALSTLQRHGYEVLEASSSVEALMLAQHYCRAVHVAVSELIMPELSGRELAKRLLHHHPGMKVLFLSGYDDETIFSHRINRRHLLRRPYRQTGLVEKLRELIDTGSARGEAA